MPALERWLRAIERGYHDNPYHNGIHAADVVVRLGAMLERSLIARTLLAEEHPDGAILLLSALLAAAIHDFDHKGLTNAFMVATQAEEALHFNDQNVMENHSIWWALSLAREDGLCFYREMSTKQKATLRATVIGMVLGTDMSRHFEIIHAVQSKVVKKEPLHRDSGEMARRLSSVRVQDLTRAIACRDVMCRGVTRENLPHLSAA